MNNQDRLQIYAISFEMVYKGVVPYGIWYVIQFSSKNQDNLGRDNFFDLDWFG